MTLHLPVWFDCRNFIHLNVGGRHGRQLESRRRRQRQVVDYCVWREIWRSLWVRMGYLAMAGQSMGLLHVVNTGAPGIAYKTAYLQEFNSD